MIASISGEVIFKGIDRAVIEVSGMGMEVLATPDTLAGLREGTQGQLFTIMIVREDAITLYGFANREEKAVFEVLIGISRIGPKLALAALAALGATGLKQAVQTKDETALTRIPGVGKKSAQRLLVEIGDKLGSITSGPPIGSTIGNRNQDVVTALTQLGWNESQAVEAVEAVGNCSTVPETLRAALAWLGARRG